MYGGWENTYSDDYIHYILEKYSAGIIRLCRAYVHSIHDAEDIAEEVFCCLISRRPDFESSEHEKAWLYRAAVNRCKNHLRSARITHCFSLDDVLAEIIPSEATACGEESGTVTEELMKLPEKYRITLHLYYYEQMSMAQIADIEHISQATVGTRLARGRALLKKRLGGEIDV